MNLNWPPEHSGTKIHATQVIEVPLFAIRSPLKMERCVNTKDPVPRPNMDTYRTDQSNSAGLKWLYSHLSSSTFFTLDGLVPRLSNQTPELELMTMYSRSSSYYLNLLPAFAHAGGFGFSPFPDWLPHEINSLLHTQLLLIGFSERLAYELGFSNMLNY